jgi:hypothetical protein
MSQKIRVLAHVLTAVESCRRQGQIINSTALARDLMKRMPDCGSSEAEIAEMISWAAARAEIPPAKERH